MIVAQVVSPSVALPAELVKQVIFRLSLLSIVFELLTNQCKVCLLYLSYCLLSLSYCLLSLNYCLFYLSY